MSVLFLRRLPKMVAAALVVTLIVCAAVVCAADDKQEKQDDRWHFSIIPYVWLPKSVSGKIEPRCVFRLDRR